jgi:hypothetical protein
VCTPDILPPFLEVNPGSRLPRGPVYVFSISPKP